MDLDDQDLIPIIEQAVTLLNIAVQKGGDTNPLILKQLILAAEMTERCLGDLKEIENAT